MTNESTATNGESAGEILADAVRGILLKPPVGDRRETVHRVNLVGSASLLTSGYKALRKLSTAAAEGLLLVTLRTRFRC